MRLQTEMAPKFKGLFGVTLMLLGISLFALFIYVRFISPSARDTVKSGFLSILLIGFLAMLVTASLINFSGIASRAYPSIARLPSRVFMILTLCCLVFTVVLGYRIDSIRIVLYLLTCLLVSLALNLVVYVRVGKQKQHP